MFNDQSLKFMKHGIKYTLALSVRMHVERAREKERERDSERMIIVTNKLLI